MDLQHDIATAVELQHMFARIPFDLDPRILGPVQRKMLAAPTYLCNGEFMDLTLAQIPVPEDFTLNPVNLITPSGFVVLEETVAAYAGEDPHDVESLERLPETISSFFWLDEPDGDFTIGGLTWDGRVVSEATPHLVLGIWQAGHTLGEVQNTITEDMTRSIVPLFAAFVTLAQMRLASVTHRRLPRAMRRRNKDIKLPDGVRIVELRRHQPPRERADEPDAVEYSHRWISSMHWGQRWCKQEDGSLELEWRLIPASVKGPADKPLLIRKTIYVADR